MFSLIKESGNKSFVREYNEKNRSSFEACTFKFNSNLDGRNFLVKSLRFPQRVFPHPCLSPFSRHCPSLYTSPVPPLLFMRTISFAAFNLNASFRIFPSLVCQFLNRYVALSLLSSSFLSFLSSSLLSFSPSFAPNERNALLVKPPLPEIIPYFFHLAYLQNFFFVILYRRETRDLLGGIDTTLKTRTSNLRKVFEPS